MVPRVGLEGQKISSQQIFDSGPSSSQTLAIPAELPPYIGYVYWELFLYYNRDKIVISHSIQKTIRNKLSLINRYIKFRSSLILYSTICCSEKI